MYSNKKSDENMRAWFGAGYETCKYPYASTDAGKKVKKPDSGGGDSLKSATSNLRLDDLLFHLQFLICLCFL
jgi:hypothetical protein